MVFDGCMFRNNWSKNDGADNIWKSQVFGQTPLRQGFTLPRPRVVPISPVAWLPLSVVRVSRVTTTLATSVTALLCPT